VVSRWLRPRDHPSLLTLNSPTIHTQCASRYLHASRPRTKARKRKNQLRHLREFALHSGWNLVREYVDHESGKVSHREQFQRMFEEASRRQFDVLLFWSLNRLSREGILRTLAYAKTHRLRRRLSQLYRAVFRLLRHLLRRRDCHRRNSRQAGTDSYLGAGEGRLDDGTQ